MLMLKVKLAMLAMMTKMMLTMSCRVVAVDKVVDDTTANGYDDADDDDDDDEASVIS